MKTITGRYFQIGEQDKLAELARDYGVQLEQKNIDCYTDIGMEGWWGEKGLHQGLHDMNPIRGEFVIDLLKQYQQSNFDQIIEVGCGGGIFSEYIAKQEALATKYGIEFAKDQNNPYGFLIKSIELIEGEFHMKSIHVKDDFTIYIGYGIKK